MLPCSIIVQRMAATTGARFAVSVAFAADEQDGGLSVLTTADSTFHPVAPESDVAVNEDCVTVKVLRGTEREVALNADHLREVIVGSDGRMCLISAVVPSML
jgi:hypothetical protein